jgi:hypothetical protein
MSKSVVVILVAAAAVVAGIIVWKKKAAAAPLRFSAPPPPEPRPLQGVLADAFSDLVRGVTNAGVQWFSDKVNKPAAPEGMGGKGTVTEKPAPVTGQGPSVAVPAGSTPNVLTTASYWA